MNNLYKVERLIAGEFRKVTYEVIETPEYNVVRLTDAGKKNDQVRFFIKRNI